MPHCFGEKQSDYSHQIKQTVSSIRSKKIKECHSASQGVRTKKYYINHETLKIIKH